MPNGGTKLEVQCLHCAMRLVIDRIRGAEIKRLADHLLISYVGRVVGVTSATSSTSATLTASRQVVAGDTLLVAVLLTSTSSLTGAVSATDGAGNVYTVDRDQNDPVRARMRPGSGQLDHPFSLAFALPVAGGTILRAARSDEPRASAARSGQVR